MDKHFMPYPHTEIPYCTFEISSTDGMGLTGLDSLPVDCAFL